METNALKREQEGREKAFTLLESLEGYQKLHPRQQAIIRHSLYVDDRAQRGHGYLEDVGDAKGYNKSLNHVDKWNCHKAVYNLEKGQSLREDSPTYPGIFLESAAPYQIKTLPELTSKIKENGFPCLIQVQGAHSFVALGVHPSTGEIVIWEKLGTGNTYRFGTLQTTFDMYNAFGSAHLRYGVRPLRILRDEDISSV